MLYIFLEFEWDAGKEEANYRKHGLRFASVISLWQDPLAIEIWDSDSPSEEDRWIRMGTTRLGVVAIAVFCKRETRIRIISARRAAKREERDYREFCE